MPDAAVELARRMRVEWAADPRNPLAPPHQRRVIEVDSRPRRGLFSRLSGAPKYYRPIPRPGKVNVAADTGPRMLGELGQLPVPSETVASMNMPDQSMSWVGKPGINLLQSSGTMTWRERRMLEKAQREEQKAQERMIRAQKQIHAAQIEEYRRWEKAEAKRLKKEEKQKMKQLKWEQSHPFRPLPIPTPPEPITTAIATAAAAAAANDGVAVTPTATASSEPMKFMMLPSMEEFGVRRPLDPRTEKWPIMSRTMRFAMLDLNRDEKIHMIMNGSRWRGD